MRYCLIVLVLAGCVSTSEVMEVGKDRYMVSATMAGNFPEWDDVKGLALTKARDHCKSLGKQLEADRWQTSGVRGLSRLRAELTYRCD